MKKRISLMESTTSIIKRGLNILDICADSSQIQMWIDHLYYLKEWNQVLNMTRITEFDLMIKKHLFDVLSVSPFILGENIIDVGSGGGLPGIPLAILYPLKKFYLIEKSKKKCIFLEYVIRKLSLSNAVVICSRIEEYKETIFFDAVIARAFSNIVTIVKLCRKFIRTGGRIYAMKSSYKTEIKNLNKQGFSYDVCQIRVPFSENFLRHLITIKC